MPGFESRQGYQLIFPGNCANILEARSVAQLVEQRSPNSRLGIPMRGVKYEIELLCQLLNPVLSIE